VFIFLRQGSELQDTIDQGLRSRAADITTLVTEANSGLSESGRSPLTETGESVAQILDPWGRVVDAPPALRNRPIAGAATVRRAATRGTTFVNRATVPTSDGETRLLATPVTVGGKRLVVVVGASLEAQEKSQHSLAALLGLAGLGALACAAAAGFGVVSAALAPMEAMRRRAGEIQATEPGARLPVPRAQDEVHRLGETLNSMLDRLEDAFTRERQFVSDASHELRTPLAILKAELELALWTDASPGEPALRAARRRARNGDRGRRRRRRAGRGRSAPPRAGAGKPGGERPAPWRGPGDALRRPVLRSSDRAQGLRPRPGLW